MLKNVFSKKEVSAEDKKKKMNNQMYICFGILLFAIAFILFGPKSSTTNNKTEDTISSTTLSETEKEDIIKSFDKISDNYTLDIEVTQNEKTFNLIYYKESNIELYEGNALDADGYMLYNGKSYVLNNDAVKETKSNNYELLVKKPYYNILLLKNIFKISTYKKNSNFEVECNFTLSDYLKEYNYEYNKNYKVTEDANLTMKVVHYSSGITKITMDYSNIDKIINNSSDNLSYIIKIQNSNENDFSTIIETYGLK